MTDRFSDTRTFSQFGYGLVCSARCGFKYFLFSPLPGEDSHFDEYFSVRLKLPTSSGNCDSWKWTCSDLQPCFC